MQDRPYDEPAVPHVLVLWYRRLADFSLIALCLAALIGFAMHEHVYLLEQDEQWLVDTMRQCPRSAVYLVGTGLTRTYPDTNNSSSEGKGSIPSKRMEEAPGRWRDLYIMRYHDVHKAGPIGRAMRRALLGIEEPLP